jgi:hypothetical protein
MPAPLPVLLATYQMIIDQVNTKTNFIAKAATDSTTAAAP